MAMKYSSSLVVAVFVFAVAVTTMNTQVEGLACGQAISFSSPCVTYLQGEAPLSPFCCNGVKILNKLAKTTVDRQTACKCLKSYAAAVYGLNYGLAASLPEKCGVNIPYEISPSIDCTKIK